jgi:hypothetical protein
MTFLSLGHIKPAAAASIIYEGTVGLNETVTGTMTYSFTPSSARNPDPPPATGQYGSFWVFEGTAGDTYRFTAQRLFDDSIDPDFNQPSSGRVLFDIWQGTASNFGSFFTAVDANGNPFPESVFSETGSADTPLLASAGSLPFANFSAYSNATVRLTLPETGRYTIGILPIVQPFFGSISPYNYALRVPFADSGMIVGSGLVLGLGLILKRKSIRSART